MLPSQQQERYLEQWTADLADTPEFLEKLLFALDLYRASLLILRQRDKVEARKAVVIDTEAVKAVDLSQGQRNMRDPSAPRPRVLVVDDEPVIANTLAIILQQCGYAAKSAFSGEEGIALARDFKPQTLIADVVMTGMTGMTGIKTGIQIRSFLPECDIWLFAGQAATANLIERAAREGHVFNVLSKPVHPSELLKHLKAAALTTSNITLNQNGEIYPRVLG